VWFFHAQKNGGAEKWDGALSEQRAEVEKTHAFTTTMDYDNAFTEDLSLEDRMKIKFKATKGLYFDFDGEDLTEILGMARIFAEKLKHDYDFNMDSARLYFTGGRGVHVEIPFQVLVPKVAPTGYLSLPLTFKEMAFSLFVDGVDMRVYSTRRMWRTPNIKRDNGLHKVQVSTHEFMTATADEYREICSTPRPLFEPLAVGMNSKLAFLFNSKYDEVEKKSKARARNPPKPAGFTEWPDSLRLICSGTGVTENMGWNQIALQLASTALAISKSEDALVQMCEGLITNHESDGRYNSPRKRERELRNQYRYQQGNPAYSFSVGGLLSLYADQSMAQDVRSSDPGANQEEEDAAIDLPDDEVPEAAQAESEDNDKLAQGIKWNRSGLFILKEEEWKVVSHLGITDVLALYSLEKTSEIIGYEAKIFASGECKGSQFIPSSVFTTKAALNGFTLRWSCSTAGIPETLASPIADYLRQRTTRSGNRMYTVTREGIDIVIPPKSEKGVCHIIYAGADGVKVTGDGPKYHFAGTHEKDGVFKSDLMDAPDFVASEMEPFIKDLFQINSKETLGKFIGWFSACFLCQPIRHVWAQFPTLQVYGEAGSGKSKTVELFNHMHYWEKHPKKMSASGQTFFPILAAISQSASFPVIFEEFKPREMAKYAKDMILNVVRNNYEGNAVERGGLSKETGPKGIVVNGYRNTAPLAFVGEAMETQTAALERCVVVPMSKYNRSGRSQAFERLHMERQKMGIIGRALAELIMQGLQFEVLRADLLKYQMKFREEMPIELYENQSRPVFNLCVVMLGLDLFKFMLNRYYDTQFDKDIEDMREAILSNVEMNVPQSVSEIAKVLDVLARLTRHPDMAVRLDPLMDYAVAGETVSLKLKPIYAKYSTYCKQTSTERMFDSDTALMKALEAYPGLVSKHADAPGIRRNPFEVIFDVSVRALEADNIEPFGGA
jgi:hypothetical protein